MKAVFIIFCLLAVNCVSAQSLEERFRAFQQSAHVNYQSFRAKANQQYADFMRLAWEDHFANSPIPVPEEVVVPPVVYDDEKLQKDEELVKQDEKNNDEINHDVKGNEVIVEVVITPPLPQPQPEPIAEPEPIPHSDEYTCIFDYFNTTCSVRVPLQLLRLSAATNEDFAQGWEILSNGEYEATLADCLRLRDELSLCDWGYLLMLSEFSKNAYLADNNEATLLCAWLYCQSGYQMRLALDGARLNLLYASQHTIYRKSYFNLEGQKYYPLKAASKSLQICTVAFEKEQALSLHVVDYPRLQTDYSDIRLLQSKKYDDIQVSVKTNRNLLSFYETYPSNELNNNALTRWAMYANTPLTEEVRNMMYPALYSHLKGCDYRVAVEKVLNFVQTAFVYEYDDKVWGGDRAFFAEETLFYPYADCEDRSILFSRLVRDLLRLPVLLVYYPGHVATAVAFPTEESGDYIMVDGVRYTVCDPTYIGAPVGDTMPGMDNKTAQVMLLN